MPLRAALSPLGLNRILGGLIAVGLTTMAPAQPRVGWTTSRVEGTPEPPKAFVAEPVMTQLKLADGIDLATVPGTDRLLIVERRGRILAVPLSGDPETGDEVINLLPLQPKLDNVFSAVLPPRYRETRQIYVCYALTAGLREGSRVSRFTLTSLEPLRADPKSEEIVITWRSGGHNGCSLQFGPDGYLYISTGDAGPAAPPDLYNTGQDVSDLEGSILRIDVDGREAGRNYRVPPDNPWADGGAAAGRPGKIRPELWAYGLRNPWRMSFDRATGNLWCGDIGWELWEMVHLIKRGANYGWSAYEASQPIKPELENRLAPITRPIVTHTHAEAASITGGFVYHGKQFPELAGAYVYGDYVTGKIWALWHDGSQVTRHEEIADTPHNIVAFGQADDGELYLLHYPGRSSVHRLARNPRAAPGLTFPRTLGATGLFSDVARQVPAPGVEPFAITSPLWEDGAVARRWIGLRNTSSIVTTARIRPERNATEIKADYTTTWPAGAVLARTVSLGALALTPEERDKPVETQLLHYDGEGWNAYTYRWNEAATDAELVPAEGAERTFRVAADPHAAGSRSRDYTWRFESRAECLRCHNSRTTGALAFTPAQLRGAGSNQVNALIDRAMVDANFFEQTRLGGESSVGPHASARAYLHVNCAPCHSAHAGGSVMIFLSQELLTGQMNIVDVAPAQGGLGLKSPQLVAPGDPWNSVLALRMAKSGAGHMPLVGAREVDVAGLRLIEDWIARLPTAAAVAKPWDDATWDDAAIEQAIATVSGALRLRRAIDDGKLDAARRSHAFTLAWASAEPTVRDLFERFKPDDRREKTLGANVDAAALLRLPGDPVRGAALVAAEGKLGSCQACHLIRGQGRQFGPDLSRIGAQQTREQILESLLHPSKTVAPLYRTTVFELRDGSAQAGFVRARGAREIVLAVAAGQSVKIPLGEITAEKPQPNSLMPEGLLQGLTPPEAADLVAYLASLK